MISLPKTRSIKRFSLLALGVVSLLGGLFMAVKLIKTSRVDAANDLGQVTIESPDNTWIMYWSDQDEGAYGSGNLWYINHTVNLSTPRIGVMTADNTKVAYDAYCVDPTKTAPDGSGYNVVVMPTSRPYNKIKLAVLLSSIYRNINGKFKDQKLINKVNAIVNSWLENADTGSNTKWNNDEGEYLEDGEIKFEGTFPDINTNAGKKDYIYLMTHLTISYMLHGNINDLYTDYMDNDDSRDQADWAVLDAIRTSVDLLISDNDDLWIMAQNYVLYGITGQPDGVQDVVWIEDGDPASGSLKVQKCDKETSVCSPQGNASFQGISFTVANNSGGRIYAEGITNPKDNTNFFDNGDIMATGTTGSDGTYTFSGLPLGVQYKVTETSTNSSYLMPATADASQNVTINSEATPEVLKFYDDVARGDFKFIKVDENNNSSPMSNVVFRITNSKGTESHIIVSDSNGEVSTSKVDHNKNTNGYDQYVDDDGKVSPGIAYNSNTGIWFGSDTPDNSRGALPYDTYEITELKCDANKFCYDIGDTKKTVTIKTDGEVVDLGEWSNDCAEFSITTTATDNADGDKIVAFNEDVEIKDVVDYCLKKDMEFTIKGVVMNKNTKEPVMVDGKRVEQVITFTPESTCGTTEMIYSLNTKDLGGTDLVIFEELYYGDELILSHSDFDNASQTVSVAPPPPDTGAITKTTNGGILSNNATIIVFVIGGSLGLYASARAFSRKRFLNKKY